MGVEILLVVDLLQGEEYLIPQLTAAHRRGIQHQHAGARALGEVVVAVLVLHQDLRLEARQQEPDGVVLPIRGAEQARPAHLRQPVAVDDAGGGAAGPQVIVELLLEFGREVGAAHEHDLQLGKVDVGHGLEPGIQYGLAGEQHVDPVMLDRLGIARVGGAKGQADDLHAQAQRRMQHVHHRVDPGHVQGQVGDHVLRGVLEIRIGILGLQGAHHKGVHGLVGQGNRLVHAADGAGGVEYDGRLALAVGDGERLVLLQKVLHHQAAFHVAEQVLVHVPDHLQHGDAELAAHRALQQYDVAQAQHLPVAQQALHQLGEGVILGNQQVRDLLALNHAVDLLLIVQVEGIDEGHGRAGHVQAVERENRFGQGRADQRHPRAVLGGDVDAGKRLGVPLPVAEHLAVGVLAVAVRDGHAVQALRAVGIQFLDKRPARLVNQLAALQALHRLLKLFLLALLHRETQ